MSLPDFFHQKMSISRCVSQGIIKKHAAGRRTFSVASHLKTRIHIILHCKTFIPITYMIISFTNACRARAPFDHCFVNNILAS